MTSRRLPQGGLIDRSQRLAFRFNGRRLHGHPGDTLASALLANGVALVGRSFKYHRPRGIWGAWSDDPNAIVDVRLGARQVANCPAATTPLEDGMELTTVSGWPSTRRDLLGGLDRLHRFLPAGFYYKTFLWPNWHFWEPMIRRMAGLGQIDPDGAQDYDAIPSHDAADLLVVGGGIAGLVAARAAAEAGQDVLLVDDQAEPGGGVFAMGQAPD
ncbi:MAG TPA: FAD-dependent oxidoreductase, partial [Aliiroseovarius sp.]|nr:FAD-dependent oxidoreductase [Aliiroseovarius sp.]